ncbi:MAG: SIMPL domain-containing protein [Chitinophagaceae bacterium]|jgi:hypothetical protein|nr:SIMPL domain-containing protein [Chitinophagaceae bacterium]
MQHLGKIIIAITIIITAFILAGAWKYRFKGEETIVVTGLAEKDFTSDLIVWRGRFAQTNTNLKSAYQAIKDNEKAVRAYLVSKGLPDSSFTFSSVDLLRQYDNKFDNYGRNIGSEFKGYELSESVTVRSADLALVERVSREVTELLEQGIEFNSQAPEYYYTRLNELKIDLLAKASEDAQLRAQTIAANSGSSLGNLRKASMGVFQITGKNMNEDYSYGGVFNTSSKEKTASITLRAEYKTE